MYITWVPHQPGSWSGRGKAPWTRLLEAAFKKHMKTHSSWPKRATLYLSADEKSLDKIEFDYGRFGA